MMNADLDRLPHGPAWSVREFVIQDVQDRGRSCVQHLFARDIVDVVRDLMGNERFKDPMRYALERRYTSATKQTRVYSETWTANWWWRMQVSSRSIYNIRELTPRQQLLPDRNGTIAALILSSDKTTLSYMSGGQMAYPVYVTLGNIDKLIRRKGSEGATVLLGYLPINKFEDVPSKEEPERLTGELVHRAMEVLLEPLREASEKGVEIWCADGRLRRVFPLVAVFVGDWPEQCLMACVEQGSCPICRTGWTGRGDNIRRQCGRAWKRWRRLASTTRRTI
jgi:hypothetical protein